MTIFGPGSLFKSPLGTKAYLLFVGVFLLALLPFGLAVFTAISYFGQYTIDVNQEQLRKQADRYMELATREQAQHHELFFSRALLASSILAQRAENIYNNIDYYADMSPQKVELNINSHNGMYVSPVERENMTLYWGGEQIDDVAMLEIDGLYNMDFLLQEVKERFEGSYATYMISRSGIGKYYNESPEATLAILELPPASEFDLRSGMPMAMFLDSSSLKQKAQWTGVYADSVTGRPVITVSTPVIDKEGELRAIAGIDIELNTLLEKLTIGYDEGGDESVLFSFIINENARPIAFTDKYTQHLGVDRSEDSPADDNDVFDTSLLGSPKTGIRHIMTRILGSKGGTERVEIDDEVYIFTHQRIEDPGWHLVLVSKESFFNISIARTEEALSETRNKLFFRFIATALLMLISVMIAVYYSLRYFVSPLGKLSEAATRVGKGDLTARVEIERNDELKSLGDSFNSMVDRLEQAEQVNREHAEHLEREVNRQTRDVNRKNTELRDVIARLNSESEQRQLAVAALEESEEQIRTAMDASLAGLCIVQEAGFKYANPQFAHTFGYEVDELLDGFNPMDLVLPQMREAVQKGWRSVLSGRVANTRNIKCLRRDGTVFEVLAGGYMTVWQGKPAVVATVVDISEQIRKEKELRDKQELLEDSLREKEVLMREIYHRTKNNMLVIISMLNLQALDIEDERIKDLFKDIENRIRAMSLAHEKLYQSKSLTEVDLATYLEDMTKALVATMVYGKHIRVEMGEAPKVNVSLDAIVPLGLAVNEIVTNSIKHGFREKENGTISIGLDKYEDGNIVVKMGDDGCGIPEGVDLHNSPSLGLQITVSLIERQLYGSIEVNRDNGTHYTITFRETGRPDRL